MTSNSLFYAIMSGFIGGALFGLLPVALIFFVAWRKAKRREETYRTFRNHLTPDELSLTILNVRYCSEKRYKKIFKFFPWEMFGIMVVRPDSIDVRLRSDDGKRNERIVFDRENDTIDWLGMSSFMLNGALSWIAIGPANGPRHYFTSETGTSVFGSKKRSRKLIDALQASLRLQRCINCEYQLWGNVTGVCPECGTPFTLPRNNERE